MTDRVEGRGSRVEVEREDGPLGAEASTPPPSTLHPPPSLSRRTALKVLGTAPVLGVGALVGQQPPQQQRPRQPHATPNQPTQDTRERPASAPRRQFFTQRELRTVRVLADDIIPRDERSGSATDAKVPEFIDFNLSVEETPERTRVLWRGGLRWLDTESRRRFGVPYASARENQRHQILDDLAWPDSVRPEHRHGAAFFARVRDMVAAGFFSSAIGFRDLQWTGNTFNPEWKGCPEEALRKLGVTYD